MENKFYLVASGSLDIGEAKKYFFPVWEAEPDSSVSDEEYFLWEKRNPIHRFRDDIAVNFDIDFIELVDDSKYVLGQIVESEADLISLESLERYKIFVILFEDAFASGLPDPACFSRSRYDLVFIGEYNTQLR